MVDDYVNVRNSNDDVIQYTDPCYIALRREATQRRCYSVRV